MERRKDKELVKKGGGKGATSLQAFYSNRLNNRLNYRKKNYMKKGNKPKHRYKKKKIKLKQITLTRKKKK